MKLFSFFTRKKTKKQREKTFDSVSRSSKNPIMSPDNSVDWRSWQTFNPAAVLLDDRVHLLYRAIGADGVSRFGYASSPDGFQIDDCPEKPAYREMSGDVRYAVYSMRSGGSFVGCEDPRLVHMEDEDTIYLTYTSCSDGLRMAISSISTDDFRAKRWHMWKRPRFMSPPGEVHKNWVLFPEKIQGKYAICHSLSPLSIEYLDNLDFADGAYIQSVYTPGEPSERWDSYTRGVGPPPIKTDSGWLLFYHAMNHGNMSHYKIGAMLLDIEDPTKVLHRSDKPVIRPEDMCEIEGYKNGVVYASGAVVKDDRLLLYYGGADSFVCVAYANLSTFLSELESGAVAATSMRRNILRAIGNCFKRK